MFKRILLGVLVLFVAIQFIRPAKNVSAQAPGPDDFVVKFSPPAQVGQILHTACYDCHSNNTRYPWYNQVQPVAWWLASHINDGKRALNLSDFGKYSAVRQAKKLNQMSDQITNRDMPIASYKLIHGDARLSQAEIDTVSAWLDDLHDKIAPAK